MAESSEIVEPTESLFRVILELMNSKHATTLFRLFMSLSVAGGAYYGPDLVNIAIAKSPEVMASKKAVSETQRSLEALKVSVDRLLDQQADVLASIKDEREGRQAIKTGLAVLTEHVADVEKQLDRVELKQDR